VPMALVMAGCASLAAVLAAVTLRPGLVAD
jgi:hypothetical protein